MLTLPARNIEERADGTLWQKDIPILGITDAEEKSKAVAAVKSKRYQDIPAAAFCKLGENENGLWIGTPEEWAKHPNRPQADEEQRLRDAQKAKIVSVRLSSRGWGDFSPVEWRGDITRPTTEILAECKGLLANGHDVDFPNRGDEEIIADIEKARTDWEQKPEREAAARKAEAAALQKKIDTGYCFSCESWCHGDCGNYSRDPDVMFRRQLKLAQREERFGVND